MHAFGPSLTRTSKTILLVRPFRCHRVRVRGLRYELLTFRKPFPGDSPDEVLRRQLDRTIDFAPPRELNPDIPAAAERTILRCLEREPDKRYPFMSVVVRDLQSALYV